MAAGLSPAPVKNMRETAELWQVRLPNGRLWRATADVIHQRVQTGRLPHDIEVRRSSKDEWHPLHTVREFRDLPNGEPSNGTGSVASRLDPGQLHYAGLRSLLEELLAALDSMLVPRKLMVTALFGVPAAILALIAYAPALLPGPPYAVYPWLFGAASVAVLLALIGVLSRMAFIELSHLRQARIREGLSGLPGPWLALVCSLGVATGLFAGAHIGLWALVEQIDAALEVRVSPFSSLVASAIEAALVVPMLLLLPLAAVLAVEECSLWSGIALWWRSVREEGWRMLIGQWIALAVAIVLIMPAYLVLVLPLWRAVPAESAALAGSAVVLLLSPFALAYAALSNVFLYLHFRYTGGK